MDPTFHFLPWLLQPGPPAVAPKPVFFGVQLAWKGAPAGAGGNLKQAKEESQKRIRKATAICVAAGNSPLAKANLEKTKIEEAKKMTDKITEAAKSGASIHACISIAPFPVGIPHGPGLVINGSKTVFVQGLPVCRMGDEILEAFGPKNFIALGLLTLFVGDSPTTPFDKIIQAALKALLNLQEIALRLAGVIEDLISDPKSTIKGLIQNALARIRAIAANLAHLLGVDGAKGKIATIVNNVRKEVEDMVDAATRAAQKAAEGSPGDAAADIAEKVKQAAQKFQQGLLDAARKEEEKQRQKLENMKRNAGKILNAASDKVDEIAKQDGPAGEIARKLQAERDELLRKKDNAAKLADKGVEKGREAADEARQLRDRAREEKQAAERQAKEAARKVGELADQFANGLDDAPETPQLHDHPEATH